MTTPKNLYEDLDAIHASLPDTERQRFAEVIGLLTTVQASERRQLLTATAQRWRTAQGYPRYQP